MNKTCSKCGVEKPKVDFKVDNTKKDGRYSSCKSCVKEYRANHYINNKEFYRLKALNDYQNNKQAIKKRVAEYSKKKKKIDPLFKLKAKLRTKTYQSFKKKFWTKTSSNIDMLGCSFEKAKSHIENKFYDGMCWENHGEWHIDHIKPLCSAKNADELIKLFHYTNLQPLWAKDNLHKAGKLIKKHNEV